MKNVVGVETKWIFKLPNDSNVELEPWADQGESTPEQAFEQHIIDNSIFMIKPRTGSLKLWEQKTLMFTMFQKKLSFFTLK